MSDIAIMVAGCTGRMGRAILQAVNDGDGVRIAGGFDRTGCADAGRDIGSLIGADDLGLAVMDAPNPDLSACDVLIDFTAPAASVQNAAAAAQAGAAHVIGTTGFAPEDEAAIAEAATRTPIVKAGNMSLGVNLLTALVERAAAALSDDYDIEILDIHHRHKVDAPSGTALMLGEAAARGRGAVLEEKAVHGRHGVGDPRRAGDIGFAVLRAGGVVGEHSVKFAAMDEIVELRHQAQDRGLFARGAVTAAKWAAGRAPGLYSMRDVLGL